MQIEHKNGVVTVSFRFDASKAASYRTSATGKTRIVDTTSGFVMVPGCDGLKLNLTATVPNEQAPAPSKAK
jgi:hypothetical protein